MNNLKRYTETRYLSYFLGNTWLLNLYILKNNYNECVNENMQDSIINKSLLQLETECFSNEFEYLKTGFAFLHYGRRGVCLSIWHIGIWEGTYEIFCCNWYCYGRDIDNMELLNSAEPRICQYELELAKKELDKIRSIIRRVKTKLEFKDLYINFYDNCSCRAIR